METTSPCNISLYVSTDGGRTWTGPLKKVKGDIGNNTLGGNNKIEWSVLEEYNDFTGSNIKFQVRVENKLEIATVKIGSQIWSTSNLKVSRYRNGDEIPEVQDRKAWAKLTTGAWCYYENKTDNGDTYGKLYNWYAVNDPRGLAPEGYHIPTDAEWTNLAEYLGAKSGKKLKTTTGWINGGNGKNSFGFNGFASGQRSYDGSFKLLGLDGSWWSATDYDTNGAWGRGFYYSLEDLGEYRYNKTYGFTVRCLKD